jgi:hypothetical protein
MAADQTPPAGGNTPKPTSAKEKSKAQSRSIPAKGAPKAGSATGGNKPRPGQKPGAAPGSTRNTGTLIAWGAVVVVVIVIAVIIVVATTGGKSTPTTYTPTTSAPASIVTDVTSVPTSVYNTVGVKYPASANPVTPPVVVKNQPPLTIKGKSPAMLYYGAEYCPYCAAERWAMATSLARFGTFSGLKITASSHTDVYPITNTLSFAGATFTSSYLSFFAVERYTNIPNPGQPQPYTSLDTPNKEEQAAAEKYSGPTYIPGAQAGGISFPFVDIGNKALISGASFNPGILGGLTWGEIAGNLKDASNPVTQAIIATSNYISASICASDGGQPSTVCTSSGVQAAAKALKLS